MSEQERQPLKQRWRTGHLLWHPDSPDVVTSYFEIVPYEDEPEANLYTILAYNWKNNIYASQVPDDPKRQTRLINLRQAWLALEDYETDMADIACKNPEELFFTRDPALAKGIHYSQAFSRAAALPVERKVSSSIASRMLKGETYAQTKFPKGKCPDCPPPTPRIVFMPKGRHHEIQWSEAIPWRTNPQKFNIVHIKIIAPKTQVERFNVETTGAVHLTRDEADLKLQLIETAVRQRMRNQSPHNLEYFNDEETSEELPYGLGTAAKILACTDLKEFHYKDPALIKKPSAP